MSSEELKLCPFCGSPAKSDNGFSPAESITYAWCSNTECQLHSVDVGMTPADWNQRALPKVDPQPPTVSVTWHESPESVHRAMWEEVAVAEGMTYEQLIAESEGEVNRYDAVHIRYEDNNIRYGEGCEVEVVTARDYDALEAEFERLRAQVSALQSDANSWQSGYDKGREDGAKAAEGWKAQHARDSAELRRLCAERDALRQQLADSDAALRESRANDQASMGHLADIRHQRDKLAGLLREVRVIVAREVERWTRAAAILPVNANVESGLLTRIDAALAEVNK